MDNEEEISDYFNVNSCGWLVGTVAAKFVPTARVEAISSKTSEHTSMSSKRWFLSAALTT